MSEETSIEMYDGGDDDHGHGHGSPKESKNINLKETEAAVGPTAPRNVISLLCSFNICSLMCFDKYES